MSVQSFAFAGFSFPRSVAQLVRPDYCGTPAPLTRTRHRFKVSTSYQTAPAPITRGARAESFSYYLDSDFAPDLRWQWCDDVSGARITHTGWFTDENGEGDKIRGLVLRLPHGRGFLAGWSMGEGMATTVERYRYDSEVDAAHAADSIADRASEDNWQHLTEQDEEADA